MYIVLVANYSVITRYEQRIYHRDSLPVIYSLNTDSLISTLRIVICAK